MRLGLVVLMQADLDGELIWPLLTLLLRTWQACGKAPMRHQTHLLQLLLHLPAECRCPELHRPRHFLFSRPLESGRCRGLNSAPWRYGLVLGNACGHGPISP